MTESYFCLFSSCKITFGNQFTTIVDLQRGETYRFNKSINEVLRFKHIRVGSAVWEQYEIVLNYFVSEEIGFITNEPYSFPGIDTVFKYPALISNAIVEIGLNTKSAFQGMLNQLMELGCRYLELRYYIENADLVVETLSKVLNFSINNLIVYFPYNCSHMLQEVANIEQILKLATIILYGSPKDEVGKNSMIYIRSNVDSNICCGNIQEELFVMNLKAYSEGMMFNSCLNLKISIDSNGNIRNCPSMKETFGNIRDTTLSEALQKTGFKKYWRINKDQIAVCKDCEFRYICTDCRAYVEDPYDASGPDGTNLSKPLKCGYNPYTGEWAEWSTNPLKQKAIDFYGMRDMVNAQLSSE